MNITRGPDVNWPQNDTFDGPDYMSFTQKSEYSKSSGILVIPFACGSCTGDVLVIRTHQPVEFRKINWQAIKAGNPPVIPVGEDTIGRGEDGSIVDSLISSKYVVTMPAPIAGGGFVWIASGEFVYIQGQPRDVGTEGLPIGTLPYNRTSDNDDAYTQTTMPETNESPNVRSFFINPFKQVFDYSKFPACYFTVNTTDLIEF